MAAEQDRAEQNSVEQGVSAARSRRRLMVAHTYLMLKRSERYLPPIVRGLLGFMLMLLGALGFLPILGFWIIPLGLGLLATDIPPFRRRLKTQINARRRHNKPEFAAFPASVRSASDLLVWLIGILHDVQIAGVVYADNIMGTVVHKWRCPKLVHAQVFDVCQDGLDERAMTYQRHALAVVVVLNRFNRFHGAILQLEK